MKETLSAIAVILTFVGYTPYYKDIINGKTRPHVYSWGLWSILTIVLVALQLKGGAGPAIWVSVAAGLLCGGVALLALKNGRKEITRSDTVVALLSLIAIACWLIADQPVTAMILLIVADMLAFIPTVRKSWFKPHKETLSLYLITTVRFLLALGAVEKYTFLSSAWIIAWILSNGLFSLFLIVRRKQVVDNGNF